MIVVIVMNLEQFVGPKRFMITGGGFFLTWMMLNIAQKTEIILDRELDCFSLIRRGLFSTKLFKCALTDISSVRIQELPGVKPTDHFRRVAVLRNDEWIPLTVYWHTNKDECLRISKAIERILHLGIRFEG
ncbi:MAG: hypothetical protein HYT79_05510 [Elusimicrobia bacterium]|nr:hypothetical protein [Elusimicrobiota bacterium]